MDTLEKIRCQTLRRAAVVFRWMLALGLGWSVRPVTAPDAAAADLRAALGDTNALGADHWIYNDLPAAFARAKATGKPLWVVFRCVKTPLGAGFDATVMRTNRTLIELARSQFVCARVVDLAAVDLSQFQFDYDLPWAAMFLNADGTVYGRFGSMAGGDFEAENTEVALQRAALQALVLHAQYPTNAPALAAKRGAPKPYRTVTQMPAFDGRREAYGPGEGQTCIRCHAVHDAENIRWQSQGFLPFEKLWRYPSPASIGVELDPKAGCRVRKVLPASPAQLAGLEDTDTVVQLHGQPVGSIADVQWVLHQLPNTNLTLEVEYLREVVLPASGGTTGAAEFTREQRLHKARLQLARGWKQTDFAWRASNLAIKPRLGFTTLALSDEEIFALNLPPGVAAHRVKTLEFDRPEGRAAAEAGLRVGDVIVAVAGKAFSLNPREWQLYIKQSYKVGDTVPLTILRAGRSLPIELSLK